jgi:hypothetical protein
MRAKLGRKRKKKKLTKVAASAATERGWIHRQLGDLMSVHLLRLPTILLTGLLVDWLDIVSLLSLDSSCCSGASRKAYLELTATDEFCLHRLRSNFIAQCVKWHECLKWCVARKAKIKRVVADGRGTMLGVGTGDLKAFMHICGAEIQNLEFIHFYEAPTLPVVMECVGLRSSRLRTLVVHACWSIDGAAFGALLSHCAHSLKCLSVEGSWFSLSALVVLTAPLPDLHMLHIFDCKLRPERMCQLVAASRSLRSFHCDDTSAMCLDAVAAHCPLLQVLACQTWDHDDVSSLENVLRSCPDIQVVNLNPTKCSRMAQSVSHKEIATVMQHCKKLKAFMGVDDVLPTSDASLYAVAARMSDLRYLSISCCESTSEAALRSLAQNCRNLLSLELSSPTMDYPQDVLAAFVSNLKGLTYLCIRGKVTNPVLSAVGSNCLLLQTLHLRHSTGYHGVGISAVAYGCTALRKVYCRPDDPCLSEAARLLWQAARPLVEFELRDTYVPLWERLHDIERKEIAMW